MPSDCPSTVWSVNNLIPGVCISQLSAVCLSFYCCVFFFHGDGHVNVMISAKLLCRVCERFKY